MPLTVLFSLRRILTRRHLTRMRKYCGNRESHGSPSLLRNRNRPRRRNRPSKFPSGMIGVFYHKITHEQNGKQMSPLPIYHYPAFLSISQTNWQLSSVLFLRYQVAYPTGKIRPDVTILENIKGLGHEIEFKYVLGQKNKQFQQKISTSPGLKFSKCFSDDGLGKNIFENKRLLVHHCVL